MRIKKLALTLGSVALLGVSTTPVKAGQLWDGLPEEKKEIVIAFYSALRDKGYEHGSASAMAARGYAESGFDPWLLENYNGGAYQGQSSWEARMGAPMEHVPPAYGYHQMQGRAPGDRLGNMLKKVEEWDGGSGTKDKVKAAYAEGLFVAEELEAKDEFGAYGVRTSGAGGTQTPTVFYSIDLTEYGFEGPYDSLEKFKKIKDPRLATLVWTMSMVRPADWALTRDYKVKDLPMAEELNEVLKDKYKGGGASESSGDKTVELKGVEGVSGGDFGPLALEHELVGMKKREYIHETQKNLEKSTFEGLSTKERYNVTAVKRLVNRKSDEWFIYNARVTFAMLGIVSIIYSVFMVIAYIFDANNSLLEWSILGLLTGGRIKMMSGMSAEEQREASRKLAAVSLSTLAVSIFIVSGAVYGVLDGVLTKLAELLQLLY